MTDFDPTIARAVRLPMPVYPDGRDFFSPHRAYPEAGFDHLSSAPNPIYDAIRRLLLEAGLDSGRAQTPAWSPFSDFVAPGGRVFVLCNFVHHRLGAESRDDFLAKCTHPAVIRPVLDYALKAVGPEGRVEFGNAPLQAGDWGRTLAETGADRLLEFFSSRAPGRVEARDLRGFRVERSWLGSMKPPEERVGVEVELDLGSDSLLEQLAGNRRYRVAQYDPRRTASYHRAGAHVYAVHRRIAEADLIVSVPKLKTHEKVGVTAALKGCVGATALKQCLAHFRQGSPAEGGDEYRRPNPLFRLLAAESDWTWTHDEGPCVNAGRVLERFAHAAVRRTGGVMGGAWPGNDTCWRMSLDIARAVAWAAADGTRRDRPRPHLVVMDGVIGGEGQGPLRPHAIPAGYLSFAADPYLSDFAAALAMGYDPDAIPLIRNAPGLRAAPVTALQPGDVKLVLDGRPIDPAGLVQAMGGTFVPPHGWAGVLEYRPRRSG